jgi:hypothetical protein
MPPALNPACCDPEVPSPESLSSTPSDGAVNRLLKKIAALPVRPVE